MAQLNPTSDTDTTAAIDEVLGHSALEVTMTIYGHVMLDAQRRALAGMDALLADDD